ncbi:MAG: hypothetical protein IT585_12605 [candidate division Zixibacteria bacterium]|nr:hypothetical protein [candidate division Zixibacteria bacterium]
MEVPQFRYAGSMSNTKNNPIVSERLQNGTIMETVYCASAKQTQLVTLTDGVISMRAVLTTASGEEFVPVAASNNLIKHGALLFAEKAEPYDSLSDLVSNIESYIYRYVDLSDHFLKLSCYYVLLSWVYDAFNELPYLRFRGDYGSGQSRALFVIGSLAYKPFFASGASTVSPIFHTLDSFRGTLIFDEADFRFSDEKSELIKIFNNGNVRGFPVLRTTITTTRQFDPRAFNVYGPKIVAMRKAFEDQALESRFLTEEMGQRQLRPGIPINLPDVQQTEATALRNKLLMYRFNTLPRAKIDPSLADPTLSPRLNQILVPLLSIIPDSALRQDVVVAARGFDQKLRQDRSSTIEANVLEVLRDRLKLERGPSVPIGDITSEVNRRFGVDYERPVTPRIVGSILRKRLRLPTWKSHGVYVIAASEREKVNALAERYGVPESGSEACG